MEATVTDTVEAKDAKGNPIRVGNLIVTDDSIIGNVTQVVHDVVFFKPTWQEPVGMGTAEPPDEIYHHEIERCWVIATGIALPDGSSASQEPAPTTKPDRLTIWAMMQWPDECEMGYLLTGNGGIDDIRAYIHHGGFEPKDAKDALALAQSIEGRPDLLLHPRVQNLALSGRTYDGPAVPPFIYAHGCYPLDEEGKAVTDSPVVFSNPTNLPRLKADIERIIHDEMTIGENHPNHHLRRVGVCDPEDGMGVYLDLYSVKE